MFRIVALVAALAGSAFAAIPSARAGQPADLLRAHLEAGTLAAGEAALRPLADTAPADPEAQFALGGIQLLRAVEALGQDFHRHGLQAPEGFGAPLFRMPVPPNPQPEPLTYPGLRTILQGFVDRLAAAEATLAKVGPGEAKIPLDLAAVRLDLDGDGEAGDPERLLVLLAVADPTGAGFASPGGPEGAPDLRFTFDRADAIWLRGYANILAGFADFLLAHDFSASFEGSFHLLFPRAGLPMSAEASPGAALFTPDDALWADAVAFIHLIRWPVAEPERMARLRERLLSVINLSRENWRTILSETDDDREWLPAPRQTTPFPGLDVTDEQVATWLSFLDTGEALLEGRLLLPHWRFSRGVDLRRVFIEPRPFDLVMWITGQGASPFLADGPSLRRDDAALSAFEGRFLRYVIWFN